MEFTTAKRQDLLVEIKKGVLMLTLNRPQALNAFSEEMITGLQEELQKAEQNEEIGAVLITGAGRSFCAGGDVKGMGSAEPIAAFDHIGKLNELIVTMTNSRLPIVTAVHGYAAGAGVCLALASDLILAAENSKFVMSFSKVGLISDGGGLFFLPRTLGLYRAKELLFLAEPFSAKKAYEWGMVNHLHAEEALHEEALQYAKCLAAGPQRAYGMIKKLANEALVSDLFAILERERTVQAMMVTTNDHKEGVTAFVEKRLPRFQGK
jgi:2-(1,2-epoxy-1,2-dihydrophenyl)acetyl-CoA isomerase